MLRIGTLLAAAAAAFAFGVAGASAAPGDLDRSFGNRGVVFTPNQSAGRALALQQNGRIVAVGNRGYDGERIEIARYLRDGDLDPTFGNDGRASIFSQDDGCPVVFPAAAGIDSLSRIVIAGSLAQCSSESNLVVVRVLPGGDLDTSFGDQGVMVLDPGVDDAAVGLELRPDDSVLVGGYVSYFRQDSAFIVARLDDQGALDSDYGVGGTAIVPLGHRGSVAAMAVDARGRATLAEPWNPDQAVDMIRLTGRGELDDSFSSDGRRALDLGRREQVRTLAIGKRGRIFVGGSVAERRPRRTRHTNLALARLYSNGSINRRFGHRGIVTTDMGRDDYASDLEPQADGKIVVSAIGDQYGDRNYPQRWAVLRYRKRGKLDRSFSGNGRAFPKIHGSPPTMEMQPNGRILLLGWSWGDDVDIDPIGFMLARLRNDGRPLGG
jgi:uncharacterized delta-60 repeat protein